MEFVLHKPNKKGSGCAVKFNVHQSGKYTFMLAAPQFAPMGSKNIFAWKDKSQYINLKMNATDLGALLSVIIRMQPEAKLFHQTQDDTKTVNFAYTPEFKAYGLSMTQQVKGQPLKKMFLSLTMPETMILKVYVENALRHILESNVWSGHDEREE